MAKKIDLGVWAGDEASFHQYLTTVEANDKIYAGMANSFQDDEDDVPYLYEKSNGVATISVTGAMTNQTRWYDSFVKSATYQAIREALVYAATDEEVSHVVLNINSPGGMVNGLADTAKLVSLLNKSKPVTAYTDGQMCSAAYWLGSAAGSIYASDVSDVGSIGVITTHMDYSEALKQEGIKATVIRSGKYKALGSSVEPLSAEAKAEIQARLDSVYKVFVQNVATARNQPYDYVDENMAQGRVFVGAGALAAGLIDGITTYDSLMSQLEKLSVDNFSSREQTSRKSMTHFNNGAQIMPKALTDQALAALAAGVELPVEASAAPAEETPAAHASAENESPNTEATEVETEKTSDASGVVALLQSQLAQANESLINVRVELATAQAALKASQENEAAFVAIAASSTNNMRVALGGSRLDMSGMTAAQVLADHAKMETQFKDSFKAGGVAAVSAADDTNQVSGVDHMFHARMETVSRPTKKA